MNEFPGSSSSEDERMRRLLDDAVSDVEPSDSLDSIRARTKVKAMNIRRNWFLGAGAAAVATAATITAVAVMGGSPGTTGAQDPGFAGSESPTPSGKPSGSSEEPSSAESSAASPELVTVPVYYVGDTSRGPRLFREFTKVRADRDPAVEAVGAAVGVEASDPDYTSPWFGTSTTGVSVGHSDGTITVDLATDSVYRERPDGMSKEEASIAIEQVVYTVQGTLQSRDPVQLLLNGSRSDMVLGVPTSEPLAQGQDFDVLAMVWIIEPAEGAQLQSPFKVAGLANAFEANVQWELMQGDAVVDSGFTTARECCTMAPYSFKVTAPPGDYTLVVHDSDPSDGEGFAPWQDTKNITVAE